VCCAKFPKQKEIQAMVSHRPLTYLSAFRTAAVALMLVATGSANGQVSCRPNSFTGGYDCDNGVSTRPNSFTGGYDIDDRTYRLRQELDQGRRQQMRELNRQPTYDNRGWVIIYLTENHAWSTTAATDRRCARLSMSGWSPSQNCANALMTLAESALD
jgi:hypothetical protein